MRKVLYAFVCLAIILVAGCEENPSNPAGQPIVGTWVATSVGEAFAPATTMEVEFKSDGTFMMETSGLAITGTYTTSGSSGSSSIRSITINAATPASATMTGIYRISGTQMELEVVESPLPVGVVGPDAVEGIGSTTVNGTATNDYVSVLVKQ